MKKYNFILTITFLFALLQDSFAKSPYSCPTGPGIFIAILAFVFGAPILLILLLIVVLSMLTVKKVIRNIENNKEPMTFQKASDILGRTKMFLIIYFAAGVIIGIIINYFNIKFPSVFKTFLNLLYYLLLFSPLIYVYCHFVEKIIQKLQAMQENKVTELKPFTRFLAVEGFLMAFIGAAVLTIELFAIYYLNKLL